MTALVLTAQVGQNKDRPERKFFLTLIDTAFLITAFVTLFVIIDPIGLAPLFIAITQGMSQKKRRSIALRAVGVGGAVLFLFAVFGESVL